MMMQELPMEQITGLASGGGGAGGDGHQSHLDRLENLEEEVGVDVKPGWEAGDIKPPWDTRKMVSPPSPHHLDPRPQWIRPEDYEDEQRAKSVLETDGGHRRPEFCESLPEEAEHYPGSGGPFSGPNGSPFHEGPPTPHGVHSFSPESMMHNGLDGPPGPGGGASKKSSSRRNAWGNLSYADLITQAILSSPEKRLTLSQVYDWMVQNIPYFKDKGDSNSSAGWKNSIRHNLSLHSKFIRVQNEGTGKSSWWMVNPDATKTGKSSRRRASNPDNGKFPDNRRRGRTKKSLDGFGAGQESTPSPNGILEGFPDSPLPPGLPFPHDMRLRPGPGPNGAPEFVPGPGGRISPLRHEYFHEAAAGGWPGAPPGHPGPGQEYHGNMVAYPHPHGFRPEFCEGPGGEAMMERIGMDPRMSPHPGMPPHLRPNGFPYPRPPFHPHDPAFPHSPLLGHPAAGEHFPGHAHVSPGHVSPLPAPGYPSPDHVAGAPQCPTPVSGGQEALMSPVHQMAGAAQSHARQFFPPNSGPSSCAQAPDSPAPGSSSSSGSMLERALTAKQEPGEEGEGVQGPPHPEHHPHLHPGHPHHHHQAPPGDWPPHIASDFGDVNVQDYIKNDYGMENLEFGGYPGHPHHGPGPEHGEQQHPGQYPGHGPHPAQQVSVAPPWVR